MKKTIVAMVVFGAAAPAAFAASGTVNVTHSAVNPGSKVTVSGTASGCGSSVTLASLAFSSKHKTGKLPSVTAKVSGGKYSVKVKLKGSDAGKYKISASCKGKTFASTHLKVNGSPGGGFYPPAGD